MIVEDEILNEWQIYSVREFQKAFKIKEVKDESECDDDYIFGHLGEDKRIFRVIIVKRVKKNPYIKFWIIHEISE